MTIAKRIVAVTAALGVALLVAGTGIVMAFLTLQRLVTSTHEEFHELCDLRKIAAHVTQAERLLANGERESTEAELREALAKLAQYDRFQREELSVFGTKHNREEEGTSRFILTAISTARAAVASPESSPSVDPRIALQRADDALSSLVARTEQAIADVHTETAQRFAGAVWLIGIIEVASFAAAVAISLLLYRSVVGPLRRLQDGTVRLAEGKLETRLDAQGDREFVELQDGFNKMASELESLCRDLERRVAEKGQKLATAERLASVGYLAAGVAHEINNPLAIITGYAESLLRTARQFPPTETSRDWNRDLETIRDEAFRCKRITQGLLDLSRLGDEHREPVAIGRVVESCAKLIAAWPASREVAFEIQPSSCNGTLVLASEPELKQIVLNLLANAVEAAAPTRGTVTMGIGRDNGWVKVVVSDNGQGMTPDTLARVFEPFFSSGKPNSGLGLGLSISHAIARRHGGTLEASSPGPGCGATLVLKLPALREQSQ